jgi:hypothetical protein
VSPIGLYRVSGTEAGALYSSRFLSLSLSLHFVFSLSSLCLCLPVLFLSVFLLSLSLCLLSVFALSLSLCVITFWLLTFAVSLSSYSLSLCLLSVFALSLSLSSYFSFAGLCRVLFQARRRVPLLDYNEIAQYIAHLRATNRTDCPSEPSEVEGPYRSIRF